MLPGQKLGLPVQVSWNGTQSVVPRVRVRMSAPGSAFLTQHLALWFALSVRAVLYPCPFEFHDRPVMYRFICNLQQRTEALESDSSQGQIPGYSLRPGAWLPPGSSWYAFIHPCPSSMRSSHPFPLRTRQAPVLSPSFDCGKLTVCVSVAWLFNHSLIYLTFQVCTRILPRKL